MLEYWNDGAKKWVICPEQCEGGEMEYCFVVIISRSPFGKGRK